MECKEAQERILTDYIDGEMHPEAKSGVDRHLAACPVCRKFLAAAKTTEGLFAGAPREKAPEFVWYRIREALAARAGEKKEFLPGLVRALWHIFRVPKPALAIASMAALFILAGTLTSVQLGRFDIQGPAERAESEYFEYLPDYRADTVTEAERFGTSIEEYFL